MKVSLRCHAFVSPAELIVNAIVSYDDETMTLLSATPFTAETPSTSDYDGIAILGNPSAPLPSLSPDKFTVTLTLIQRSITPSTAIRLVKMG